MPGDRIRACSDYSELEYLITELADNAASDDDPLWLIDGALGDIEGDVTDLRRGRDDFERMTLKPKVCPDDEDDGEEETRRRHPKSAEDPAMSTPLADAIDLFAASGIDLAENGEALLGLVHPGEVLANLRQLADLIERTEAA